MQHPLLLRNHIVLHQRCNKHSLANLFLPHATMMQHLSYLKTIMCCINPRSLPSSFRTPLWYNISPASRNHTVLHHWCNKHLPLTSSSTCLRDATSLLLQNHNVLHHWCNKRSLAILFLLQPPWCNILSCSLAILFILQPPWCNISPTSKP